MISFPGCKINLGLRVLGKRSDGYHNIETCFYPVPWTDVIEVLPSQELIFNCTGYAIEGKPSDNLVLKVWDAIVKQFSPGTSLNIHLHKVVPSGAGLGGGSADAAAFLKLVNEQLELELTNGEMHDLIKPLGADCAFFIENKPALGKEKGDVLNPVEVSLEGKYLVVIHPGIHIATSEAYSLVTPSADGKPLNEVLSSPVEEWKHVLVNDFEGPLMKRYPELLTIKEQLYDAGAAYAAMSGSGSAVFGIFKDIPQLADTPAAYKKYEIFLPAPC